MSDMSFGLDAIQDVEKSEYMKDRRRFVMPQSSKFIDDMRENFGELIGIEAEENGQVVKWGVDWSDGQSFMANP